MLPFTFRLQVDKILAGESGLLQHGLPVLRPGESVELADKVAQRLARQVFLFLLRDVCRDQVAQLGLPVEVRIGRVARSPLAPCRF
jgi:hypothetical protein